MLFKVILDIIKETLKIMFHIHLWKYSISEIKGYDFETRECKCGKKQIKTRLPICHIGNRSFDDNKWLTV